MCLEISCENGNSLWQDAIALKMGAVCVAFNIMNEGEEPPPRYHSLYGGHLMLDIKLDGFWHKAQLVARVHMTETPAVLT